MQCMLHLGLAIQAPTARAGRRPYLHKYDCCKEALFYDLRRLAAALD